MDLKPGRRMRESAIIATLTVLTLLLLPLLVIVGTALYVASVVRLNVIVFGEGARALRAWAAATGDAA